MIAFDVTRLFLGPLARAPRGIDRIDLAVAHHLFADAASPHLGVLPTPWGMRAFDAPRIMRGLAYLDRHWAESSEAGDDPLWRDLVRWLLDSSALTAVERRPDNGLLARGKRLAGELAATGIALGRGVRSAIPPGAVYLNVGQIGLAVPLFHSWLHDRKDVTAVFMLHDVIPIDHPELVEPASRSHHARMVRTTAEHADGLIVTTGYASTSVAGEIARHRSDPLPTLVRRLPLPRTFIMPRESDPALADCRYFVACGSIEPRKNHALLFEAWRRMAAQSGRDVPKLVLVGSPGWKAEEILRPLTDEPALQRAILHVSGLSSPALARLMLGAAAVLCPSKAEGFGLPLLEANALGVPTIASDIPAHREVADAGTILLGCEDAEDWAQAITAHPAGGVRQTPKISAERTEATYCHEILEFLSHCARENGKAPAGQPGMTMRHRSQTTRGWQ